MTTPADILSRPLELAPGVLVGNRFAKAAMSEHLATRHGAPSGKLIGAYRRWAQSGAALLFTGNVMVDGSSLEAPRNVVIEDERHLEPLRALASATDRTGAKLLLQLSHPGRQAMRWLSLPGRRQDVVAPSPIKLATAGAMFRTPRELPEADIERLVERFAYAAAIGAKAGFAGVQLHAAHGYLFSQFLSPLVNKRTDRWGGSLTNRMRFLVETVRAVERATPKGHLIAVKLNSADFQRGGFDSDDSLHVAQALEAEGVHLLEISGGTYEAAAMAHYGVPERESTRKREAFFLEFAERMAAELRMPLMLTGGFRTAAGMAEAVESGAVAVVGLARPLAHEPDLPKRIPAGQAKRSAVRRHTVGNKTFDDLIDTSWHQQQIARMGAGKSLACDRSNWAALALGVAGNLRDSTWQRFPALPGRGARR